MKREFNLKDDPETIDPIIIDHEGEDDDNKNPGEIDGHPVKPT